MRIALVNCVLLERSRLQESAEKGIDWGNAPMPFTLAAPLPLPYLPSLDHRFYCMYGMVSDKWGSLVVCVHRCMVLCIKENVGFPFYECEGSSADAVWSTPNSYIGV